MKYFIKIIALNKTYLFRGLMKNGIVPENSGFQPYYFNDRNLANQMALQLCQISDVYDVLIYEKDRSNIKLLDRVNFKSVNELFEQIKNSSLN